MKNQFEGLRVALIPWDQWMPLWGRVKEMLQPVAERTGGRWTVDDVAVRLANGHSQLWVAYDHEGIIHAAATTMINNYPSAKMLCVHMVGGTRMSEWMQDGFDLMKRFAADNQCDGVEFYGRSGWAKHMKALGFEKPNVIGTFVFERNN